MHVRKVVFLLVILTGFIIGIWFMPSNTSDPLDSNSNFRHRNFYGEEINDPKTIPKIAARDIIEDGFTAKLNEYSINGYFNQMYEPSLQATYYALYIMDALGRLDAIDQTAITNYIMAHYNTTTHIFTDNYALRYLDTDDNKIYYPFTTLLEVNCYAILSLDILNQLSLIATQDSFEFILSCYHPDSHGFIGQPYDTCPSGNLEIPTMDNTYYAIITLDVLNEDLDTIRHDVLQYIKDLQDQVWGFENDVDYSFKSLGVTMLEPNLLSAYYCIKSLDMYGYADSIDTINFHNYLQTLYDTQNFIFQMGSLYTPDKDNLIASALGLQLSDLTPFQGEYFLDSGDRSGVINFILNNRNSMGNWDSSTPYEFHELMDTFQIVRGLIESGAISQLTAADKNEIFDSLSYYNSSGGYSLLSRDYTSVEQYYNVINSFYLYDRIADIDLQGVYETIRGSFLYDSLFDTNYFYACTNIPIQELVAGRQTIPGGGFRTYPIEYFTMGKREIVKQWSRTNDHTTNYMALDTLTKIFKLDDFEQDYDLNDMLDDVVDCQFLESGYSNYGAFLPSITLSSMPPSYQNSEITFRHSYYAIKCMELLSNYLNLGPITDLNFNKMDLHNYVINNIVDDGTYLYFDPKYTDNVETILENTFYMIYVLNAIDTYALDDNKIENFLLQNLNYSNMKNIYYSYKISEILDLDISFDLGLTNTLIQAIYSEELHEFYMTSDRKTIEQQAFLWICEFDFSSFFINGAPTVNIITPQEDEIIEDDSRWYTVSASVSDPDNDMLDVNLMIYNESMVPMFPTPKTMTFNHSSGLYELSLDLENYYAGTYMFNVSAYDGHETVLDSVNAAIDETHCAILNIEHLENIEFLSSGNYLEFEISSNYSITYIVWINGIEFDAGGYSNGTYVRTIDLDYYNDKLGDYTVRIEATDSKGHNAETTASFSVYSASSTVVDITHLNSYEFKSEGNYILFNISSKYPNLYTFSIDDIEIDSGIFTNGQEFNYSIDGYLVGTHHVSIWANALDGKEGIAEATFTVYSLSETIIKVNDIDNYMYGATGNILNFSISSSYPDRYEVYIDSLLIASNQFMSGNDIIFFLDGYEPGKHEITIWAIGEDFKETTYNLEFWVFVESFVHINILYLDNYEFKSTGNIVRFSVNASFPDLYRLYIDNILIYEDYYEFGCPEFIFSIDGYLCGEHNITIISNGTMGKTSICGTSFSVYSSSNTIVYMELYDFEYSTTGNDFTYNISSWYPNRYALYIDGEEKINDVFEDKKDYTFPLDGYSVGTHDVYIWAIGEDFKIGVAFGQFSVYSNNTLLININSIENYEFTTTSHYANFSFSSKYGGDYNISINGILKQQGNFMPDEEILYLLDGYGVGNHTIQIQAKSIDLKEIDYTSVFCVYSRYSTLIHIYNLSGFEFMSTGNYLNFSINSQYPDKFLVYIDDEIVASNTFSNDALISLSLDYYSHQIGNHSIKIWAVGLDLSECTIEAVFTVYSNSVTIVNIDQLFNCEYGSVNNELIFTIYSEYPDYYELYIDSTLVSSGTFKDGIPISYSLNQYAKELGNHTVYIWATGLDKKIGTNFAYFEVYGTQDDVSSGDDILEGENIIEDAIKTVERIFYDPLLLFMTGCGIGGIVITGHTLIKKKSRHKTLLSLINH